MELWFTERQTPDVGITCKVNRTLHSEKSEFQDIAVIETEQFGRMLVLDGLVQTTVKDEFVYHEMITHPPLFTHPLPKKVLVIGGGDGGTVREILKHPSVEQVDLVEIDGRVVELCKEYFPEISCQLGNPKANVLIKDGIKHVNDPANKGTYDVIIVDSSDPVGPGIGLFRLEFYQAIFDCLKDDGVFVAQTESPFYHADLIKDVSNSIKKIFPVCRLYLTSIPTYPSGFWSFTLGSKKYDPLQVDTEKLPEINTKYYSSRIHKAAFALPKFVENMVR